MTLVQNLLQPLNGSRLIVKIAFLLFCVVGYSQQPEVSHFVVHKVKKKESLSDIATRYAITTAILIEYNPDAKNGIKKRDKLQIPRFKQPIILSKAQPVYAKHTVQPKETLWRIANNYLISIDSLRALNPSLGDTLSIGAILKVPLVLKKTDTAAYTYYTVLPKEGFYTLEKKLGLTRAALEALNPSLLLSGLQAGMILKISKIEKDIMPLPKLAEKPSFWDSTFVTPVVRIALMAPFRMARIELDSINQTQKTLSERNLTTLSLDFYAGMLHAADSLNKAGLSVELTVFDTENQLYVVEGLLNQEDFTRFDAVIGPFTPINVNRVARGLSFFNIPVISPLATSNVAAQKTLFNTIPSEKVLNEKIELYIDSLNAKTENPCVLIIADEKNQQHALKLKEKFPLAELIQPDERFGYVKPDVVDSLLTASRPNWVFLESKDLNLVTSMTSMLNAQEKEDRQVQLITHYRSATYDDANVSQAHLGNLQFTYPSYFHEKRDSVRIGFDSEYKKRFGKIPSRTAVKGFDVMVYVALRIAAKRSLFDGVSLGLGQQLQHRFEYENISGGGYGNTAAYIVQHQGFETIEITAPKVQSDSLRVR
ncbi:MAG: LysM peptidoglycan-binding domain-containing protein [Flavobacteriaceae bacterium]|nr:LysM peptidoglycan-binding domain-containing protein [Flavobacteriaceae bacterium]